MLTIHNKRLAIQFQEPGGIYTRTRFDWGGICLQILLDGCTTFLSQEATAGELGTEGVGLSDEFGIQTPIGYQQIEVGGWFPKIGVGFLQKVDSKPYDFFSDYPYQKLPVRTEKSGDVEISFLQESPVLNGWGWRLRKTFSLDGPCLKIDYTLENIGNKPLVTEQYNHNFFAIDSQVIGPDYQLQTSFPVEFEWVDGGIQVETDRLNLTEIPTTPFYALQSNCKDLQDIEWQLIHLPSFHGVRVREKYPLFKFAFWGKSHVISPEFFVWIDLQPGQSQSWKREYKFY
jgi:hypothetical protein